MRAFGRDEKTSTHALRRAVPGVLLVSISPVLVVSFAMFVHAALDILWHVFE